MPKTIDIPTELREFNNVFEKLAYRHDYSTVFGDFLDVAIKGCSPIGDFEELNSYLKNRYSLEERQKFTILCHEWIKVMDSQVTGGTDWYDAFGNYYQVLASMGKKSALGQYFTPETVCNFMAMCTGGEGTTGKFINEPACGSGRFVISFHTHYPGNYYFAEDLDPMCCKMTVLNMFIHGAVGVVINHNALTGGSFRNAWVVNECLNLNGCPTIRQVSMEEAFSFYELWKPWHEKILQRIQRVKEIANKEAANSEPVAVEQEIKFQQVEQLKLF